MTNAILTEHDRKLHASPVAIGSLEYGKGDSVNRLVYVESTEEIIDARTPREIAWHLDRIVSYAGWGPDQADQHKDTGEIVFALPSSMSLTDKSSTAARKIYEGLKFISACNGFTLNLRVHGLPPKADGKSHDWFSTYPGKPTLWAHLLFVDRSSPYVFWGQAGMFLNNNYGFKCERNGFYNQPLEAITNESGALWRDSRFPLFQELIIVRPDTPGGYEVLPYKIVDEEPKR